MKGRAAEILARTPYALLREIMLDRFRILGGDTQQVASEKLRSGLSTYLSGDVEMKAQFIGALIGFEHPSSPHLRGIQDDPDQVRQRAIAYLQEYINALLDEYPLIVFLDDVQWADAASLEAFLQIAGGCRQSRLMFVITARPEFYELRPDWDREVHGFELVHQQVWLRRLTPKDGLAMVAEILKSDRGELDILREQVVSKADGNPFYIEELIKMLVEESVLTVGPDGSWQVSSSALDALQIPPTLTAVLQARLDSLPQSQKTALQGAAVIGRVFWDAPLHSLITASDTLQADLQGLSEREFILPIDDATFGGTVEYQFKHQLLHDVAYDTVLKSQRRLYHARAAAWLAANAGANQVSGQFAAVIAHHYQQAGEPLLAVEWYCTAGEYALARGAPGQALDIFHTSIQLLPPDEQELRWRSLVGQVQAASRLGRAQAGLELSNEMLALARSLGDDYKLADALQNNAYFLGVLGEHQKEMEVIEQTLAAARKSGNQGAESIAIGLKVVSLSNSGDLPAAERAVGDALAFAMTLGEGELLAKLLINVSVFYITSGDLAQAARLTSRQIEVARRLGDLRSEAYSLENLGYQYVQLGRQEQGIEVLEQVIELAESLGDRRLAIYNQLNLGLAYLRSSEYRQARAVLEDAIASVEGKEEIFSYGSALTYLGLVHEKCGDIGQAASSFGKAIELLEEAEARGYQCDAQAGFARCIATLEGQAAALEHAQQVWDFLWENGSSALEFPFLAYLTCMNIFTVHEPKTADRVLETGCQDLIRRAEKISDPEWRQIYLHGIPEHKTLMNLRRNQK
jgi:tetratricopeptide (TPR) repeat protein